MQTVVKQNSMCMQSTLLPEVAQVILLNIVDIKKSFLFFFSSSPAVDQLQNQYFLALW